MISSIWGKSETISRPWMYRLSQRHVALSPDGNRVALLDVGTISVLSYDREEIHQSDLPAAFQQNPRNRSVVWCPQSEQVVVLSDDGSLLVLSCQCRVHGFIAHSSIGKESRDRVSFCFPFSIRNSENLWCMDMHLVCVSGDMVALRCEWEEDNESSSDMTVQVMCRFKAPTLVTVDIALFLPNRSAILLLLSSRSAQHEGELRYVQYKEAGTPPSMSVSYSMSTGFLDQSLSLIAPGASSALPFISASCDPTERLVIVLHASGKATVLCLSTSSDLPSVNVVSEMIDIPLDSHTDDERSGEVNRTISSLHFLSPSQLICLTNTGEVNTVQITVSLSGGVAITLADADAVPPPLGPCVSSATTFSSALISKNSDDGCRVHNGLLSRVAIIRSVDHWTCQLFTLTSVSADRALRTKMREGLFTAAYELADRVGEDADTVAIAEWQYQCSQYHHVTSDCQSNLSKHGIASYLKKIRSDTLVLNEVRKFASDDVGLWIVVLEEGMRRTQCAAETIMQILKKSSRSFSGLMDDSARESFMEELRNTLRESDVAMDIDTLRQRIEFRQSFVHRLLRITTYMTLKEFDVDFIAMATYIKKFCVQDLFGEYSQFGAMEYADDGLHTLMMLPIVSVAKYLAAHCLVLELKALLSLHPRVLLPKWFEILSVIPVSCRPFDYSSLIPIPIDDSVDQELSGLLRVYTIDDEAFQVPPKVVPIVDFYDNSDDHGIGFVYSAPHVSVQDVSCWRCVHNLFSESDKLVPERERENTIKHIYSWSSIANWCVSRIWHMEMYGQSSCSLSLLSVCLDRLLCQDPRAAACGEQLGLLNELRNHLAVYCELLYKNMLDQNLSFAEWALLPLESRIRDMLRRCIQNSVGGVDDMDFRRLISSIINPMISGKEKLFSNYPCTEFLANVCMFGLDESDPRHKYGSQFYASSTNLPPAFQTVIDGVAPRDWMGCLVKELADVVDISEYKDIAMENICQVAEDSLHTMDREDRCIRDTERIIQLVVKACRQYDDIGRGLAFMWRLIESTPAPETSMYTHSTESVMKELDSIQNALSACEIIKEYIFDKPMPSLSVLLPVTSRHKTMRRQYTRTLLSGVGGFATGLEPLLTSTDSDTSDPTYIPLQLEHAVVLCFCERVVSNAADAGWLKLLSDAMEIKKFLFPTLSLVWVSNVVLQGILHCHRSDMFVQIATEICNPLSRIMNTSAKKGPSLSQKIVDFGVTPQHVRHIVMQKAREAFNSASSCADMEILEALRIVSITIPVARENTHFSAENHIDDDLVQERNLLDVVNFIAMLGVELVDFVPLQLRAVHPVDAAKYILKKVPNAYNLLEDGTYLDQTSADDMSLMGESGGGEGEESEDIEDAVMRQCRLSTRPRPGQYFINTMMKLPESRGEFTCRIGLFEAVIEAAMLRGEVFDAVDVSTSLLDVCQGQTYFGHGIEERIVYAVSQVITGLSKELPIQSVLHIERTCGSTITDLKRNICFSLVSKCPSRGLLAACNLWEECLRSEGILPVSPRVSNGNDEVKTCEETTTEEMQSCQYLEAARTSLLRVIGDVLYHPTGVCALRASLSAPFDIVASACSYGELSSIIGYLMLVEDQDSVNSMFHSILRDLKQKIAKCIKVSGKKVSSFENNVTPDEGLVEQIETMGFSRNGAKRAVIATRNESMESALRWAIQHAQENDFDDPVTSTSVVGALLPDDPKPAMALADLNRAAEIVSNLANTYISVCGNKVALDCVDVFDSHAVCPDPDVIEAPTSLSSSDFEPNVGVSAPTSTESATNRFADQIKESTVSTADSETSVSEGDVLPQVNVIETSCYLERDSDNCQSVNTGTMKHPVDIPLPTVVDPFIESQACGVQSGTSVQSSHYMVGTETEKADEYCAITGATSSDELRCRYDSDSTFPSDEVGAIAKDVLHLGETNEDESDDLKVQDRPVELIAIESVTNRSDKKDTVDVPGSVLALLAKATSAVDRMSEKIAKAEALVHCGVSPMELAQGIVFTGDASLQDIVDEDMDDSGVSARKQLSNIIEDDLVPLLDALVSHRSDHAFNFVIDIVNDIPLTTLRLVTDIMTANISHEYKALSEIVANLTLFYDNEYLRRLEESYEQVSSSHDDTQRAVHALTLVLAERRFSRLFYCVCDGSVDASKTTAYPVLDVKNEAIYKFIHVFSRTPLRLLNLLRAAYIATPGVCADNLEVIKRCVIELFGFHTIGGDNDMESTSMSRDRKQTIKQQLLDDIAAIRRIKRIQTNEGVDVKKLLLSDEILPSSFFVHESDNSKTRRMIALKEISRHLAADTISPWNRAVGRLLDTGPSELGFYFCLSKLLVLHWSISNKTPDSECLNTLSEEYLQTIGSIVQKLRPEYIRVLSLAVISVDPRSEGIELLPYKYIEDEQVADFDVGIGSDVAEHILCGILSTVKMSDSVGGSDRSRPSRGITKPKGLLVSSVDSTESSENDKSRQCLTEYLLSVIAFNKILQCLPPSLHKETRRAYNDIQSAADLIQGCLLSSEVDCETICTVVEQLNAHSTQRFREPILVTPIATAFISNMVTVQEQTESSKFEHADIVNRFRKINVLIAEHNRDKFWRSYAATLCSLNDDCGFDRQEYLEMLIYRSQLASALQNVYPSAIDVSMLRYFEVNIYLLSGHVFRNLQLLCQSTADCQLSVGVVPLQLNRFENIKTRCDIVSDLVDHVWSIHHNESVQKCEIKIVVRVMRLLRLNPSTDNTVKDTIERWSQNDMTSTTQDLFSEETSTDFELFPFYLRILELCSSAGYWECFVDVLLRDMFPCAPQGSEQDRILAVAALIESFSPVLVATIRILLNRICQGCKDVNSLNKEFEECLDILNDNSLNGLDDFVVFVILFCRVPVHMYVPIKTIYPLVVGRSMDWLHNRVSTLSEEGVVEMQSYHDGSRCIADFVLELGSPTRCPALAFLLSPLALTLSLIEVHHYSEAAHLYWALAALPSAAFRNEHAYHIMESNLVTTSRPKLPFYFSCLPEVSEGSYGWGQLWATS